MSSELADIVEFISNQLQYWAVSWVMTCIGHGPLSCKSTRRSCVRSVKSVAPSNLGIGLRKGLCGDFTSTQFGVVCPGNSALRELPVAANGISGVQNAAVVATAVSGKRRMEERSAFDKRLRFSVRQTESAYRYRDIVVKKQDGFTHILLSTKSSENNTLNPEVRPCLFHSTITASLWLNCQQYTIPLHWLVIKCHLHM